MSKKILFVLTSHGEKGNTGQKTGYYLGEVTHPWKVLTEAGYEIDFVSPLGGEPPVDGFDLEDPENRLFWGNDWYRNKIQHTLRPEEVHPEDYVAIYFAGGHGAMWDLPFDSRIAGIAAAIYERQGVVGAVCHGPAGLVNVQLSDGSYLVAGKKVNGISNEEESIVGLTEVVPFLLEDKLRAQGGDYEKSAPWQVHVVTDQRLVTGQNPQSAAGVGEAIRKLLEASQ
ncbi:type 1 glutamine amidotransferase domain-containing protein [Flavihumibacter petaseus]|uniref:DJ-1/PfpI family protein n=1 Tax=Flavihumibacter petaseus NBRC 106054 TaxID=1220578 RepID=A0A0E9N3X3_9BACT|nr:type 1 glutamine amidotransferase domain-containing protein [Flavihumibacter petaseus]GAO44519.1 DJ-1/PfpI family protein [Flavihumibacter petaseus NBRC 106054]